MLYCCLRQVLDSLAAATQLTELTLYRKDVEGDLETESLPLGGLQLQPYLSKLRALQDLRVRKGMWAYVAWRG